MPKYKFTRVYIAEAPTKSEAVEKCKQNPVEYLEYESTQILVEKVESRPWLSTLSKQVTGK